MGSTSPSEPYAAAASVATLLRRLAGEREPRLGSSRLLLVDGPAGSGKTTLARALAPTPGALVHTDDLLAGWSGLPDLPATLERLVAPLAEDRPGTAPRHDWVAGRFDGEVRLEPAPLVVVEGVGSASWPAARRATLVVWVEAPYDLRMRRGLERDGEAFAPHWTAWAEAEARLFAEQGTRERADVVVDGTGGAPPEVRERPVRP